MTVQTGQQFGVEFREESFVLERAPGIVVGIVCVRCGDKVFPDLNWYDFVLGLVCSWRDQVEKLIAGKPARLQFMEGPFGVDILPSPRGDCRIRAWEERDGGFDKNGKSISRYVFEWECRAQLNDVIGGLLEFAQAIFTICRARGWGKIDLDEAGYKKLQIPRN